MNGYKQGKDLQRFRDKALELAERVPKTPDPVDRKEALKPAVQKIIDEWQEYDKKLPRFALDAIVKLQDLKAGDLKPLAKKMVSAFATGTTSVALLDSGKHALALGLVSYKTIKSYNEYRDNVSYPYRYLSRIQSELGPTLVFPATWPPMM